jgi:hypothetical protein
MGSGHLRIRSMDYWKNVSEKNGSLRDIMLKEDFENQMDGKGEKQGGMQENR